MYLVRLGGESTTRVHGRVPAALGCWGVGNSGATKRLWPSSSLNTCKGVIVAITDRVAAWRRERRVLARVSRAAWRLEQAAASPNSRNDGPWDSLSRDLTLP